MAIECARPPASKWNGHAVMVVAVVLVSASSVFFFLPLFLGSAFCSPSTGCFLGLPLFFGGSWCRTAHKILLLFWVVWAEEISGSSSRGRTETKPFYLLRLLERDSFWAFLSFFWVSLVPKGRVKPLRLHFGFPLEIQGLGSSSDVHACAWAFQFLRLVMLRRLPLLSLHLFSWDVLQRYTNAEVKWSDLDIRMDIN